MPAMAINIMKKLLTLFASITVTLGLFYMVANAAPVTPAVGGGTGTSTLPALGSLLAGQSASQYCVLPVGSNGQVPVASSTAPCGISWQAQSGGGSATTTITASGTTVNGPAITFGSSTTILPFVNAGVLQWLLVNTGNWAGTWQGVNSTTFYLASNPNGYTSNVGTVTTSTGLTPTFIPIITGAGSIGNSSISQSGGTTLINGTTPLFDGGGDFIGPNIFMGVTTTAALGNVSQSGGVELFTTSTQITGAQFCGGGYIDVMSTTATTTITLPTFAQIASSTCGASAYVSSFAQQFLRNNSSFNVIQAVSGTQEEIDYSPGTPTVLAPGQTWFIQGQFTGSSTIPINNPSTTLQANITLYQTSTYTNSFAYFNGVGQLVPTSTPATSINGTSSNSFAIVGDGISTTSTVNGTTTTIIAIGAVGDANYYFTSVASDLSSNFVASDTPQSTSASTTVAALSNGTTSIQKWSTQASVPSLPFIPAGLIDIHIDGSQTAGTKPTFLYATLSDITSTGTVVGIIATTENGPVLTGSTNDYDLLASLSEPYTMASTTDRLQVNVIASVSGALLAPTVQIYYGGTSADSRLELPASTADVTNFVPYVGAIKSVNLGVNSIVATNITTTNVTSSYIATNSAGQIVATTTFPAPSSTIYGAGTYLGTSGSNLTVSSTIASSSFTLAINNATTTAPSFTKASWDYKISLSKIACVDEAGTTTLQIYKSTGITSNTNLSQIVASLPCGTGGNSTTTFTTSTLAANEAFFVNVTSTAGTPTLTTVVINAFKL